MPFVVDASVAACWCFPDENSAAAADTAMDRLLHDEVIAPGLRTLEITNILIVSERHGRISPEETDANEALSRAGGPRNARLLSGYGESCGRKSPALLRAAIPMPTDLEPGSGGGIVAVGGNREDKSLAGSARYRYLDCEVGGIGPSRRVVQQGTYAGLQDCVGSR